MAITNTMTSPGFLSGLRHKQHLHAAIMQLEIISYDVDEHPENPDGGVNAGVANLYLWSAEALSCVVEVDKHLNLIKVDSMAGLVFCVPSDAMLKKPMSRCGIWGEANCCWMLHVCA